MIKRVCSILICAVLLIIYIPSISFAYDIIEYDNFNYSPNYISEKLAITASEYSMLAYDDYVWDEKDNSYYTQIGKKSNIPEGLNKKLTRQKFDDIFISPYHDGKEDNVSFTIANKLVNYYGDIRQLVVIIIRGTDEDEWKGNMNVAGEIYDSSQTVHKSFNSAKDYVLKELEGYLKKYDFNNRLLLVTGHSRGAAVANLIAHDMNQEKNQQMYGISDIFAYTFATPNVARNITSGDKNIFNFCFEDDFVPQVPLKAWGYNKYGKTYTAVAEDLYNDKSRPEFKNEMDFYILKSTLSDDVNSIRSSVDFNKQGTKDLISFVESNWESIKDYYELNPLYLGDTGRIPVVLNDIALYDFFRNYVAPAAMGTDTKPLVLKALSETFYSPIIWFFIGGSGEHAANFRLKSYINDTHQMFTYYQALKNDGFNVSYPVESCSLNIVSQNGKVIVDKNKSLYYKYEYVSLTSIPDPGYVFIGWSGDVNYSNSNIVVEMNSSKNIIANFSKNYSGSELEKLPLEELIEKENNNDNHKAQIISAHSRVTGKISNEDAVKNIFGSIQDDDYFKVVITDDGYLCYDFTSDVALNKDLLRMSVSKYPDSDDSFTVQSIFSSGSITESKSVKVTRGVYYISVNSASGWNSIGNYTFNIRYSEDEYIDEIEFNDSVNCAQNISTGIVVKGSISNVEDKDFYKINISDFGIFNYSLNNISVNQTEIYLLDQNENLISQTSAASVISSNGVYVDVGTYYLCVKSPNSNIGKYTINTSFLKSNEYFDNEDDEQEINLNCKVTGSTYAYYYYPYNKYDFVDRYKIIVSREGIFKCTFFSELDQTISLYCISDSGYEEVVSMNSNSGSKTLMTEWLNVGIYYISVSKNTQDYGECKYTFINSFSVPNGYNEKENNDTTENAQELMANNKIIGVSSHGDVDWYKVMLPSDGEFKCDLLSDVEHSVALYKSTNMNDSIALAETDNGLKASIDKLLKKGTYYVLVRTTGLGLGAYTFSNSFVCPEGYNEIDDHSSDDKAQEIALGERIVGVIGNDESKEWHSGPDEYYSKNWFKVILPYDGRLIGNFLSDKPCSFSINGMSMKSNDAQEVSSETWLKKGTYYIQIVQKDSYIYGSYSFSLSLTQPDGYNEVDNNDSIDDAQELELGSTAIGAIVKDDEADWYKINLPNCGKFTSDFAGSFSMGGANLFDSNGQQVNGFYDLWLQKGTYYIKVFSSQPYVGSNTYNGSYSLSCRLYIPDKYNEIENNDTYNAAQELVLGEQYNSVYALNDNADWYKFNMPDDGKIKCNFYYPVKETMCSFEIYNDKLEAVKYPVEEINYSYEIFKTLKKGDYFIKIYSEYIGGEYSFSLSTQITSSPAKTTLPVESVPEGLVFDSVTGTITGYTGDATDLVIPSMIGGIEVKAIGDNAFAWCTNLKSISIPNSVNSLGFYAFLGCSQLVSLDIPGSVNSIKWSTFASCDNMEVINVSSSNMNYSSEDGVLFDKSRTTLFYYPPEKKESLYTIPASVKIIEDFAFDECNNLNSIIIQDGVENISRLAINKCKNLVSIIVFKGNLNYSSQDGVLFNKNKSVLLLYLNEKVENTYIIPSSVEVVESFAFSRCKNLKNIIIPASVKNINTMAFYNCKNLSQANFLGNAPYIFKDAFYETSEDFAIYYNEGEAVEIIKGDIDGNGEYSFTLNTEITNTPTPTAIPSLPAIPTSKYSNDISKRNVDLSIKIEGSGYINDWKNDDVKSYPIGKTVSLKAISHEDSYFLYWKDSSCRVVSENPEYTFSIGSNETLTAVFITLYKHLVTFKNANGEIIETTCILDDGDIAFPKNPAMYGYTFIGWDKTADDIKTTEYNIVVTALFEKLETKFEIKVDNGTGSGEYCIKDYVTVVANTPEPNEKFLHWEDDNGNILCYSSTYKFYVTRHLNLHAIFVDTCNEAKQKASVFITNSSETDGKLSFVAERIVPVENTVISHGIIVTKNPSIGHSETNFVIGATDVLKGTAKTKGLIGTFVLNKITSQGETWYARGYIIYMDNGGNVITVYSNITEQTSSNQQI